MKGFKLFLLVYFRYFVFFFIVSELTVVSVNFLSGDLEALDWSNLVTVSIVLHLIIAFACTFYHRFMLKRVGDFQFTKENTSLRQKIEIQFNGSLDEALSFLKSIGQLPTSGYKKESDYVLVRVNSFWGGYYQYRLQKNADLLSIVVTPNWSIALLDFGLGYYRMKVISQGLKGSRFA